MFRAYQQPIIRRQNVYVANGAGYASKLTVSELVQAC
jgi:hypothetical protein